MTDKMSVYILARGIDARGAYPVGGWRAQLVTDGKYAKGYEASCYKSIRQFLAENGTLESVTVINVADDTILATVTHDAAGWTVTWSNGTTATQPETGYPQPDSKVYKAAQEKAIKDNIAFDAATLKPDYGVSFLDAFRALAKEQGWVSGGGGGGGNATLKAVKLSAQSIADRAKAESRALTPEEVSALLASLGVKV